MRLPLPFSPLIFKIHFIWQPVFLSLLQASFSPPSTFPLILIWWSLTSLKIQSPVQFIIKEQFSSTIGCISFSFCNLTFPSPFYGLAPKMCLTHSFTTCAPHTYGTTLQTLGAPPSLHQVPKKPFFPIWCLAPLSIGDVRILIVVFDLYYCMEYLNFLESLGSFLERFFIPLLRHKCFCFPYLMGQTQVEILHPFNAKDFAHSLVSVLAHHRPQYPPLTCDVCWLLEVQH